MGGHREPGEVNDHAEIVKIIKEWSLKNLPDEPRASDLNEEVQKITDAIGNFGIHSGTSSKIKPTITASNSGISPNSATCTLL